VRDIRRDDTSAAFPVTGCDAALKLLEHRGPDGTGHLDVRVMGSGRLGHTRLSIIGLRRNGSQPMTSPDGRGACGG